MAKKFIIYDSDVPFLACGNADFHNEMAPKDGKVRGGGFWHRDVANNTFYLYGTSTDFGPVSEEDVRDVIQNGLYSPSIDDMKIVFSKSLTLELAINNAVLIKDANIENNK